MNALDIIVILLFVTALLRGAERGLVRQICGTLGLLLGFYVGAFAQGKLIHLADGAVDKTLLSLTVIGCGVLIFAVVGELIGSLLKVRLDGLQHRHVDTTDKTLGSLTGGITFLVLVWLAAAIFTNAPLPGLQRQLSNSVIVSNLQARFPTAPAVVAQLGHLIDPNGFPKVFTGLEPAIDLKAPLPSLGQLDDGIQKARASVVKVEGEGCGGISTGSGFVADAGYVVTNAHVIAGVDQPLVFDASGGHNATVRWFDPNLDLAILHVKGLVGQPLVMAPDIVATQTPVAALGYPHGGDFTATAGTILESFKARGRNIYNQGDTERQVYSVKTDIQPGNSGGPLVGTDGAVLGVVFAQSSTYDKVGYALMLDPVIAGLNQAKDQQRVVGTGSCTT